MIAESVPKPPPDGPPRFLPEPPIAPETLRAVPQWVCWRFEERDSKQTKVPVNHATGLRASATNPADWTSLEAALDAAHARSDIDGVGFVFTEGDPFCGIDLDDCIDERGVVAAEAQAIIDEFGSYTEISPSGRGVKIFIRGRKPGGARSRSTQVEGFKEIEIYDRGRYFTVTGQHLAGTPTEVEDGQEALDRLCARLWPRKQASSSTRPVAAVFEGDDEALLEKARAAKNGEQFSRLWDGDPSQHADDDSAADLALCNRLAFWTCRDADRMDRLFRRSGLFRDKWDERRGDSTYGRMTIERAIADCTDTYTPAVVRERMRSTPNGLAQSCAGPSASTRASGTPQTSANTLEQLPERLLRVPGLVGEVMDHCLATAPYPNPTLAFCGALALQAFLAGRRVRDPGDNRTNLYLLGLAHSAAGKDWPRKLNARVLHAVGLSGCLGEQFASGEGIQDALFATPSMLFQTDETDALLQAVNRTRDARHESIMSTLLTIYSASNSVYPMRRRANNTNSGVIDQPSLVLFGTAIPNHYYAALSERMLTNGFFARMIVLESGPRAAGQEPSNIDPPERVLETATWWSQNSPSPNGGFPPRWVPRTVPTTDDAAGLLADIRADADAEYALAEGRSDAVAATVWGRSNEHVRKLALIYAVSEDHLDPSIGADGVRWASELVFQQTRRMLTMAVDYAAESDFDALALRVIRKLRESGGRLARSVLLRRMKQDARSFDQLMDTLIERDDVVEESVHTSGRTGTVYRLGVKEGERRVKEEGVE